MYYNNNDVRLEEMPKPKIGPGEILVRAMACGICGSDVMEWYRVKKAPRVLGHEMTGEFVEVGAGVKKFKVGDRAFVSHHVPCNTCRYCLTGHHTACETLHTTNFDPGGFAEFVRVPSLQVDRGIYLLPDDMSFEVGTFVEPLACCVRGQRQAGVRPGDSVFVIGTGISGILHILLARSLGAGMIIGSDISRYRLDAAKRFGANVVIDAKEGNVTERLREANDGRLADKVFVCTGAVQAAETALRCVDRGGTVLFFAVPEPSINVAVNFNEMWRNEVTLTTSYGASPADLATALELLRWGNFNVRDMITHRFGLAEAGEAFRLVARAENSLKVIIEPYR
ncbi:MAG: zinc-dependent dehydrogenase [Candidatus Freyarchaeota archaeon]|nr:zinc-dependent dehydrogenase [Candidatus Jordarchaeia archaeon]MBS7270534.1 zinc-dependent dehydrogenase [Candidatus Jordarchaeia archaeon]MBS7281536.1 zinc-dependent dehydrogenase [Candidatus Jordarchaeia archaeon]